MTSRWIVGIDGSNEAVDALRWAVGQASNHGAEVTAISAFHMSAMMALFAAKRGFGVDEIGLEATAGHDIDMAIESVAAEGVQSVVVEGHPQHVLVDASSNAELLVIGRTGSGELRHHLLGSVTRYCITHSHAPVAVVPEGSAVSLRPSIVVGFDGSEHAGDALRWALDFAGDNATVRTISAIEVAPWLDADLSSERFSDEIEGEEQRITAALDAVDPERRAERSIVNKGPREALAEAQEHADLVVVGARGHGRLAAGLLGSVCMSLVEEATVPLVVVRPR